MSVSRAIRAAWVLAWNGFEHVVLEDAVVEWSGETIARVGRAGVDTNPDVVHLPGHLLLPGLICLHSHAGTQANGRLVLHQGRRDVFGGGFQNTAPLRGAKRPGGDDLQVGALATLAELAMGGATTVLEAGSTEAMCDALVAARERVPVRLLVGPGFRSADYVTDSDGKICYEWHDDGGMKGLRSAAAWIERLPDRGRFNGSIGGVVYPSIVDYCTAELLVAAKQEADRLGTLLQIHACQSLFEFHEIVHRTGRTPIEWLADLGLLGPRTSLAHCFATTAHPKTAWPGGRDLELLARSGTTVAHCPVAISRRGNALHTLDGYQQAGIKVALGCDTFPRDMLNEMRTAQTMAKLIAGDFAAGSARAVIRAATVDAAAAIGRPDLGRIAPGAAADLLAVNLRSLAVGAVRDPVDAALSSASAANIARVIVAGETIVEGRRIAGIDETAILDQLQRDAEREWASMRDVHWSRQDADEAFPRSFRLARSEEFA